MTPELTIQRPYSDEDVERLRGSVSIEHTLARRGAERLREQLAQEPWVAALGALTGGQAVQMVKAGLKAIYLSGWQVAADANLAGQTYPDQSLYPATSAPALVKRLNSKLVHFVPRDNVVQHAELRRQTVIEYAPDSKQAGEYRALAEKIHANSGQGAIPTPITMEELEQMLLDFGIMKTEEEQLKALQAKEAAKVAKAAAVAHAH